MAELVNKSSTYFVIWQQNNTRDVGHQSERQLGDCSLNFTKRHQMCFLRLNIRSSQGCSTATHNSFECFSFVSSSFISVGQCRNLKSTVWVCTPSVNKLNWTENLRRAVSFVPLIMTFSLKWQREQKKIAPIFNAASRVFSKCFMNIIFYIWQPGFFPPKHWIHSAMKWTTSEAVSSSTLLMGSFSL